MLVETAITEVSRVTTATSYDEVAGPRTDRRRLLRSVVAGAMPFDAVMGVACLAAAGRFGDWLSVSTGTIRATGGVFLVAAVAGAVVLRRGVNDVRLIVAGNALFAAWCLAVVGLDGPNAVGTALFAVSALASAVTAVVEHRLAH
jgi:hypothetical protein